MDDPTRFTLMYFVVPIWLAAGLADWFCHRASRIEQTAGPKESLLHLLMFAEMGIPVLAGLFLEVTASVLLVMCLAFVAHEATAYWDVRYANTKREVTAAEQRIHSYLELMPLLALVLTALSHFNQLAALFGVSDTRPDFSIRLKDEPLSRAYISVLLPAITVFIFIPYLEELVRTLRARAARKKRIQ
ncbi:diguanylate cyclase [Comamonadaceae bacterium PP-2]